MASDAIFDLLRATRHQSVTNVEGLAVTIARAKAIGHLRRKALLDRIWRHLDDLALQVADARLVPADHVLAFDEVLSVIRLSLDDRERDLLDWKLQGKTWQELATESHEDAQTIRQRWHRTVERVRLLLRDLGFDP